MYIWVILATFLAILASYTLAPRADYRQLAVEPQAEATLSKIVTKHQAARDYVRFRKKPYTANPSIVEYAPGQISDEELEKYAYFGHEISDEFVSQIYCMNENMTVAYSDSSACSVRKNKKMVATYGPIPLRWRNMGAEGEQPNEDLMNALRNTVDGGTFFGYTVKAFHADSIRNVSGSDMQIVDRDRDDIFVPKAIVNDANFKKACDLSKGYSCLVYLSGI